MKRKEQIDQLSAMSDEDASIVRGTLSLEVSHVVADDRLAVRP